MNVVCVLGIFSMPSSPEVWLLIEDLANGETVVRIPKETILDEVNSESFGEQLFSHIDHWKGRKVTVDFDGVTYMSSGVLAKLITLNKMLRDTGGSLAVRNTDPKIYEIFVITKLNKLFRVQEGGV